MQTQLKSVQIANNAIVAAKILDSNVTTQKLANANVTDSKLAAAVRSLMLAGSTLQVMFNNAGVMAGDANFKWNASQVTVGDVTNFVAVNKNSGIKYGGTVKAKKTIVLSGAGGWGSAVNGVADPAKATYASNGVNQYVLEFPVDVDRYAEFTGVMPDAWDGGTVAATFYWSADSADTGNAIFGLQGRSYGDNEALDQAWGTAQTVTDANNAQNYVNKSGETSAITLAGTPAGGELVQFRVYRNGASGSDTFTGTVRLIAVKLEYSVTQESD